MTDSSKHRPGRRRAAPQRRGAARVVAGLVTRTRVLVLAGVVALGVLVRVVVGGDGAADDDPGQVGAAPTPYSADWRTADGSSYRITVVPVAEPVAAGSASGCVSNAGAGRTNLRFTVRIDNRGDSPAPLPAVGFAAGMTADGKPDPSLSFEEASTRIEVGPQADARTCRAIARLREDSGEEVAAGSAATFTGLVGAVRTPVSEGLTLIVRFTRADADDPSGSSTEDLVVRYPAVRQLA